MARIRDVGAQTDGDGSPATVPAAPAHVGDAHPPGPSREEEALLIAERLAALVESRRRGAAPEPAPTAPVGGVVGARHTGRLLGNLLLTRGFLVEAELQYALTRQGNSGEPIGQILVDLGLITDRDLVELLAEQLRMDVVDLRRVDFDPAIVFRLPEQTARRLAALPLRRVDGQIDVAIVDPTDDDGVGELTALLVEPLRLFLATRADIDAAIARFYG